MFSWKSLQKQLKTKETSPLFKTLLDSVEFVSSDDSILSFSVPSFLHQKQAQKYLLDEIKKEAPSSCQIVFKVNPRQSFSKNVVAKEVFESPVSMTPRAIIPKKQKLNPLYTFEDFVKGPESQFALAACQNLSEYPTNLQKENGINPLFIYGSSGLGKTHLLNAFGHKIHQRFPHLKVLYISGESFLNQCVTAMRYKKMEDFKDRFRKNCDILLVDDVQVLERGNTIQDEFFFTLNGFLENFKQVVVASDKMPKELQGLKDRIKTRFEWGVVADLQPPCLETRIAILKSKIAKKKLLVPENVVEYIASICKKSVRELEGSLNKIKMYSELQGLGITLELAQSVLASHEELRPLSIEEIQKWVAQHYKVRIQDLKSKSRKKEFLFPRQVAMFLSKELLDLNYSCIGRAFQGRDHTTVINALQKTAKKMKETPGFKKEIESLMARIKGNFHL